MSDTNLRPENVAQAIGEAWAEGVVGSGSVNACLDRLAHDLGIPRDMLKAAALEAFLRVQQRRELENALKLPAPPRTVRGMAPHPLKGWPW